MTTASHLTPLVQDLLRPESYPPPRSASLALKTTHISWVFLGEETVWKVKRPVNLGFLDFSTRATRGRCCQEELRLNRRLAPDVYQAVVPIYLTDSGHSLVGPGEVVDFAVQMRRLPDKRSAAALLAAGELDAGKLAELATHLAGFYQSLPPIEASATAALAAIVEENLQQLAVAATGLLDDDQVAAIAAAQRCDLAGQRPRLERRQSQGRIRDGHGDLRLEHVYFPTALPDRPAPPPLVIDCLEFSPRLRVGDVALDVAFLAMELLASGQPLLAEHFVYRFARASNDYDLYPVLDFFISYRALVRAKVACLLARDAGSPAVKVRRKQEEARQLLELARQREQRERPRPLVVAMTGLPGTGKSTLAEALALKVGLPVVSSDATRKFLAGVPVRSPAPAAAYSRPFSERTYQEVLARGASVLGSGRGVVLDAAFLGPESRAQARRLAAEHGARFLLVETFCNEAVLRQRLQARAREGSESDAGEAVMQQLRAAFVPASELPAAECLRADTSRPAADLVAEIVAHASH